jgi:protein O-GlcNAc transferase
MLDNLERGISLLRKALPNAPGQLDGWLKLANALIAAGRLYEVAAVFRELISAIPSRPQLHYDLISSLCERGPYYSPLKDLFEQASKKTDVDGSELYALGLIYQIGEDPDGALSCFQQSLQKNSSLAAVHYNIGVVLLAQRRLSQAVSACEAALRQQPDMAEPFFLLGSIHMDQGQLREALDCFQKFVSLAKTPDLTPYTGSAELSIGLLKEMLNTKAPDGIT